MVGAYLIICPGLYAQDYLLQYLSGFSTYPTYGEQTFHPVEFVYSSLYSMKSDTEPDGFADILQYKFGSFLRIKQNLYFAGFNSYRLRGRIQSLINDDDWMQLSLEREQVSLSKSWKLSNTWLYGTVFLSDRPGFYLEHIIPKKSTLSTGIGLSLGGMDIDYNVQDISGTIPFNWYNVSAEASLRQDKNNLTINYEGTFPSWQEDGFDNRLHLDAVTAEASYHINDKTGIHVNTNYSYVYAKLKYNNEIYGRLEHLNTLYSNLQLEYGASSYFSYRAGGRFFLNRCGENSYFDIWPFAYWDMFLAHRTRLKKMDVEFGIPYASVSYDRTWQYNKSSLTVELTLEYDHFLHHEDIIVKNRKVVMYPFIFSYDTEYYNIDTDIDGFFIIPIKLSYHIWGLEAGLSVEQLIPVDWEFLTRLNEPFEPSGSGKTRESGGTNIRFFLSFPALMLK